MEVCSHRVGDVGAYSHGVESVGACSHRVERVEVCSQHEILVNWSALEDCEPA